MNWDINFRNQQIHPRGSNSFYWSSPLELDTFLVVSAFYSKENEERKQNIDEINLWIKSE